MSRIKIALVAAATGLLMTACASSHKSTAPPPTTAPAVATPATSAPASASASAAAATGLSGTWSGHYSGAYQGTFKLTWQQSGSQLSGTIKLSAPAATLSIHGTVAGGAIRFGSVGSMAVTYSGTVSGDAMSGTYQVHTGNGVSGPWSASKVS